MQDRYGTPRQLTDPERTHLTRAVDRGDVRATLVLYDDMPPLLVKWGPMGYQETSFEKLASWLQDQSANVDMSQLNLPGPTKLRRVSRESYRLATIYPAESKVIPIGYQLGSVWQPFVDRFDIETNLTWVRVKLPPTRWTVEMRWPKNTGPLYELSGAAIHAVGRTRFKHFGIGNVGVGDGHICWGTRLATIRGVPSLAHVRDLFYTSPFNMDLQANRFVWDPGNLPWMLENHLRKNPKLTEVPARCFAGRSARRSVSPTRWLTEGEV